MTRFARLTLGRKIAAICGLFALPVAVALGFVVAGNSASLRAARLEQAGNAYQRPLTQLLVQLARHSEWAGESQKGNAAAQQPLGETQQRIEAMLAALGEVDGRLGADLQFGREELAARHREHFTLATLRREWSSLKAELRSLSAEQLTQQHAHLISDARMMITHVGDTSGLILDPDLDSYYLMDATAIVLPQAQDRVAAIRSKALEARGRGDAAERSRVEFAVFAALLKEADFSRITTDLQTSLTEDQNFYGTSDSLQRRMPEAMPAYVRANEHLLAVLTKMGSPGVDIARGELLAATDGTWQANAELWEVAVTELDGLLDRRVEHYTRLRAEAVLATGSAILLTCLVAWWVTRQVTGVLTRVVEGVRGGAQEVAVAASRINSVSQSFAQCASEQSSTLVEMAASSEELSAMATQGGDSSRSIAKLVTTTGQRFVQTGHSLEQMVAAMAAIQASSGKISTIIKAIDEIAFQTNILALNAAVEAARAGEHGLGFAVVADEVRRLSQRCAQAAQETTALIEESIALTRNGRQTVDEVAGSIRTITQDTAQVDILITGLCSGNQKQALGVRQLSQSISQVEQVAHQTAAGAEETASAAGELSSQSESLRDYVWELSEMVGGTSRSRGATENSQI